MDGAKQFLMILQVKEAQLAPSSPFNVLKVSLHYRCGIITAVQWSSAKERDNNLHMRYFDLVCVATDYCERANADTGVDIVWINKYSKIEYICGSCYK
ncbi:hypothetical protein SORBI_3002G011300 [Sorghum bicolor]|uniref:Uncharacterized protein n=1 Tax=Sorghum bicolor TaxID=4558 RepID=C5X7V4_SORBI|nr:hypothetical protein SORBI_3002G011300 [Sorghum bicolor]